MLVQKIKEWLWNQMFQYAFVKALSLKNNVDFKLDVLSYKTGFRRYWLEVFNIERNYASNDEIPWYERYKLRNCCLSYINDVYIKSFFWWLNKNHHKEKSMFSCESVVDYKILTFSDWYMEWYFQSERYFTDFKDDIRKAFKVNRELSEKNKNIIKRIQSLNSVSVHIRRWDYLLVDTHGVLSKSYYEKWIELVRERTKGPLYVFFFSDDIWWVKKNFQCKNSYYVDWNVWGESWQDMILMSKCKHNIIANSSFSRWGARLNDNKEKIVIAPRKWFKSTDPQDIVPSDWIKLWNTFDYNIE